MAHGGLLDIRRDDAHVAESRGDFGEAGNTGTVNTIVVADKDARFHSLMKGIWECFCASKARRSNAKRRHQVAFLSCSRRR